MQAALLEERGWLEMYEHNSTLYNVIYDDKRRIGKVSYFKHLDDVGIKL